MFQHFGIQELYLGCLGIGFLYVAGSLMLTGVHTGQGAGRIAGNHARGAGVRGASSSHSSTGHARVAAHSQRIAQASTAKGAHHATRVGTVRATRAHAAPSAAKGDSNSSNDVHQSNFVAQSNDSRSDLVERVYFAVMGVFNPMSISMCLFFFGLSGLVLLQVNPALARASMLAAVVIAILCTSQMQKLLGKFAAGLESSALRTIDDSIGLTGEISISIPAGRTGEVVFVLGQSKRNYSAKAANPDLPIQRGTKVIIVDVEDSVVFVEPFDESLFANEF